MKILYLLQQFPYPGDNGVNLKALAAIAFMSREHQCHVLCFMQRGERPPLDDFKRQYPKVAVLGTFATLSGVRLRMGQLCALLSGRPPSLARFTNRRFCQTLRRVMSEEHYDVVHCDTMNMARFWRYIRDIPSVISPNDALSLGSLQQLSFEHKLISKLRKWLVSRAYARFERKAYPRFTKVHVVSMVDQIYLLCRNPSLNVETIPVPVPDEVLFANGAGRTASMKNSKTRLLFALNVKSKRQSEELLRFLRSFCPRVLQGFPAIEICVVARGVSENALEEFALLRNVEVHGYVRDYISELRRAFAVVFPFEHATGIKNRVTYAMGMGKVVLGTPCAFAGIPVVDRVHAHICSNVQMFTARVLSLLSDPESAIAIGKAARALILERHTVTRVGERMVQLYSSAINEYGTQHLQAHLDFRERPRVGEAK